MLVKNGIVADPQLFHRSSSLTLETLHVSLSIFVLMLILSTTATSRTITDTIAAIGKYKPQDATTNPSLILAASKKAEYAKLMDVAVAYGKEHGKDIDSQVDATLDRLLVEFGKEILNIVPGKVSTEVDARFSFDTKGSVDKALHIIEVCELYCLWVELS